MRYFINDCILKMLKTTDGIPLVGSDIRLLFSFLMTGTIEERIAAAVIILLVIYCIKRVILFTVALLRMIFQKRNY